MDCLPVELLNSIFLDVHADSLREVTHSPDFGDDWPKRDIIALSQVNKIFRQVALSIGYRDISVDARSVVTRCSQLLEDPQKARNVRSFRLHGFWLPSPGPPDSFAVFETHRSVVNKVNRLLAETIVAIGASLQAFTFSSFLLSFDSSLAFALGWTRVRDLDIVIDSLSILPPEIFQLTNLRSLHLRARRQYESDMPQSMYPDPHVDILLRCSSKTLEHITLSEWLEPGFHYPDIYFPNLRSFAVECASHSHGPTQRQRLLAFLLRHPKLESLSHSAGQKYHTRKFKTVDPLLDSPAQLCQQGFLPNLRRFDTSCHLGTYLDILPSSPLTYVDLGDRLYGDEPTHFIRSLNGKHITTLRFRVEKACPSLLADITRSLPNLEVLHLHASKWPRMSLTKTAPLAELVEHLLTLQYLRVLEWDVKLCRAPREASIEQLQVWYSHVYEAQRIVVERIAQSCLLLDNAIWSALNTWKVTRGRLPGQIMVSLVSPIVPVM